MAVNTFIQGDALSVLRALPSESVQCCVTSPPYYALRQYLPDGHPDKSLEIGLESSPREYIEKLVEVFREVRRVLRSDGTVWLNLGDSYAANGVKQTGRNDENETDLARRAEKYGTGRIKATNSPQVRSAVTVTTGLPAKNLMMIPARVAIALCDDGWYLRSDIIWSKPNTMPESVTDRPTSAYEHVFLLAKSATYYYDQDSIREPLSPNETPTKHGSRHTQKANVVGLHHTGANMPSHFQMMQSNPAGRNKRNVWSISSQPYSEAHFATMPPKLVEPCILAGSRTGDIVLDPFSGAGTVCLVAMQHGRKYIGIELNPEYITLAENRLDSARGLWETIA